MGDNNKTNISGALWHEYEQAKNNPIFQAFAKEYNLDENSENFKEDLKRVLESVIEYNKARNTPQFKAISTFFGYDVKKPANAIDDIPGIMSIYSDYQKLKDDSLFKQIAANEGVKENRPDYVEKLITAINKYYGMKDKAVVTKVDTEVKNPIEQKKNNTVIEQIEENNEWTWSKFIDEKTQETYTGKVIGEPTKKQPKKMEVIDADFIEPSAKQNNGTKFFDDAMKEAEERIAKKEKINSEISNDASDAIKRAMEKKESRLSNLNESIEIKFNAKLGMYQLFVLGKLIKNEEPKKMSFFERRKFIKNINEKEGKFHSHKDVGKYVDPNVYELLKYVDERYPLDNNDKYSVEYLRALKDENPKSLLCNIKYDLRGINKQKEIGIIDRARIKNFAKKHEEMELAEVIRDPKAKGVRRLVAAVAGIGIAIGGIAYLNSRNDSKLLEEGKSVSTSDKENNEKTENKVKEEKNEQENVLEEDKEKDENTIKQENVVKEENVSDSKQEEIKTSEKQDLCIGKEVTVSASELYYNYDGAKPTCDVVEFMKKNPDAKFILSRIAVKTQNGKAENTISPNISIDELKEKYGQDGVEYWCNFKVETSNGTYVDIGWANEKDVQIKEEVQKENKWQLGAEYVKATNVVGKSGVSKETEDTVKQSLKDAGIEADFERL